MVYGIFEGVSGRRVGVVQALSRGVKALFPALGIVIITAIVWWLHGALLAAIFGGFGNFTVVEPWLPVFVAMMVVFAILAFFFWVICLSQCWSGDFYPVSADAYSLPKEVAGEFSAWRFCSSYLQNLSIGSPTWSRFNSS